MTTVEMEEAQSHLLELVEKALHGEPFVIANAGKPLVQVTAIDPTPPPFRKRTGFLARPIKVPDDFDTMYADEIQRLFEGEE